MGNDNVVSLAAPASVSDPLTDLLRAGARRLIEAAVSAEFGEYLSAFEGGEVARRSAADGAQRSSSGTADSDRDRRGGRSGAEGAQPVGIAGAVPLMRWCRRTCAAAQASMRRFRGCTCTGYRRVSDERAAKAALAVAALVGEEAARGLSANVVSRLKRVWDEEYREWCRRDLCRRLGVRLGGRHPQWPAR